MYSLQKPPTVQTSKLIDMWSDQHVFLQGRSLKRKKNPLLTASLPFRKNDLTHTNIICSMILNLRAEGGPENDFVGSGCFPLTVISDLQEDWLIFFFSKQIP